VFSFSGAKGKDHLENDSKSWQQNEAKNEKGEKKGKPNIAPLQPLTLATFRSWGSSAGAGRAGLPGAKITGSFPN